MKGKSYVPNSYGTKWEQAASNISCQRYIHIETNTSGTQQRPHTENTTKRANPALQRITEYRQTDKQLQWPLSSWLTVPFPQREQLCTGGSNGSKLCTGGSNGSYPPAQGGALVHMTCRPKQPPDQDQGPYSIRKFRPKCRFFGLNLSLFT